MNMIPPMNPGSQQVAIPMMTPMVLDTRVTQIQEFVHPQAGRVVVFAFTTPAGVNYYGFTEDAMRQLSTMFSSLASGLVMPAVN